MAGSKKTGVMVINGPNLNLLGSREEEFYGKHSLEDIEAFLSEMCPSNISLHFFSSNHEGKIIDEIHDNIGKAEYMILNPGALTHYSYSLRDAVKASRIKTIEVHISNIYNREKWRERSVISPVASGTISGLGTYVYKAALQYIIDDINN